MISYLAHATQSQVAEIQLAPRSVKCLFEQQLGIDWSLIQAVSELAHQLT